jgi:acetyl esterase/lipase
MMLNMIFWLYIAVVLFCFGTALAGALNTDLPRKIPFFSGIYFFYSATGQIFVGPLSLTALIALFIAVADPGTPVWLVGVNLATLTMFAVILGQAWQGCIALSCVLPDGEGPSATRFWMGVFFPVRAAPWQIRRTKNITYGQAGRQNLLDIYTPRTMPKSPMHVLIHVHGGGWVIGRKFQQAQPLIQHMTKRGWLVVDINYRLAPRHRMPAMIEDVLRAIAWVKDNVATYGGDPDFVALTGGSAGGHLVALAALASDHIAFKPEFETADCSVQACVAAYGVYDFLNREHIMGNEWKEAKLFLTSLVMPEPYDGPAKIWNKTSPISHLRAAAPPMLLLHGRHDALADFKSAQVFASELAKVSANPVLFAEIPAAQHAYDLTYSPPTIEHVRAVERFLVSIRHSAGQC